MGKIILGNTGSDIHSVANQLLEIELSRNFEVLNLGVAVPNLEWIENVKSFKPDLILIGSMNGDLSPVLDLLNCLRELHFPMKKIIVGGNLKLGANGLEIVEILKQLGTKVISDSNLNFTEISEFCQELIDTHKFKSNLI